MNIQELKVTHKKLLKKAVKANGRKETEIYLKTKIDCNRCNGVGFLRISLDATRTCLTCYGKGFLIKDV